MKVCLLAAMLVAVIMLQRPCSDSVAKFVTSFDGSGSAQMPKPGNVDRAPEGSSTAAGSNGSHAGSAESGSGYVHLTPDMTEQQVREAIEKARTSAGSQ